jgi:cytochrome c1
MKTLNLSEQEQQDIVAFMQALSSPTKPFTLPVLPI